MSIKPPQILAPRALPLPFNTLETEMMQERAAALGRVTRAFEQALSAFRDFDAAPDGVDDRQRHIRREHLLDAAAEETGAAAIEYGLIVALISVTIISVLTAIGLNLRDMAMEIAEAIGTAGT